MPIDFASSPEPTLGVEWEFALVDKRSRDLVNAASELFDLVSSRHGPQQRIQPSPRINAGSVTSPPPTTEIPAMGRRSAAR